MKLKLFKTTITVLTLLATSLFNVASAGLITAVSFDDVTNSRNTNTWVLGWEFTVVDNIIVTDLGVLDINGDGFAGEHEVGIFDMSGTLLSSTFINSTSLLGANNFRYNTINELGLFSGTSYVIAAYVGNELYTDSNNVTNLQFTPEITFNRSRFESTTAFLYPTAGSNDSLSFFGANFQYQTTSVPEPSTLAIFALGVMGLAARRFKKKA